MRRRFGVGTTLRTPRSHDAYPPAKAEDADAEPLFEADSEPEEEDAQA
jgi:hypothetical protein